MILIYLFQTGNCEAFLPGGAKGWGWSSPGDVGVGGVRFSHAYHGLPLLFCHFSLLNSTAAENKQSILHIVVKVTNFPQSPVPLIGGSLALTVHLIIVGFMESTERQIDRKVTIFSIIM